MRKLHFMAILATSLAISCARAPESGAARNIVVTYSALASLVTELVGDDFKVECLVPNGLDMHEWEPSARDIEKLNHASLVVTNGLGLEGGLARTLARAAEQGTATFVAADYVSVRTVKAGQGVPGDPDQTTGARDPHIWLDPIAMKAVVVGLAESLRSRYGVDLAARAADLALRLDKLDSELRTLSLEVPKARRVLVTGHESLGYFADRYGYAIVGTVVPSLSSQAETSGFQIHTLRETMEQSGVRVLFTEMGTPAKVAQALAAELGIRTVEIGTHALPADGSYFTMMRGLGSTIASALQENTP